MSKLFFFLKHGTLDHAKKAVASSNKELFGHAIAMNKLLDRMKAEGDPDYAKMRDDHMGEYAKDRIKSSWIVDSHHMTPEHLKVVPDHMLDRAAKNKNASPDTLRHIYDRSEGLKYSDERGSVRYRIAQHENLPKDLAQKLATDPAMRARSAAQFRLDQTMRPYPE